ncbi:hypothetical protein DFJ77DRAFT_227394 [Powellomyces hirtus]|nr:hypothetical protein DFJ77DRAFT_227394 [Powellomyces hirtus]
MSPARFLCAMVLFFKMALIPSHLHIPRIQPAFTSFLSPLIPSRQIPRTQPAFTSFLSPLIPSRQIPRTQPAFTSNFHPTHFNLGTLSTPVYALCYAFRTVKSGFTIHTPFIHINNATHFRFTFHYM